MADDVTLPGTGVVVATDDDGTRQYQWIKIAWGPNDTFNKVDTATGKPFPIQIRTSTGIEWIKAEDAASADGDFGAPILAIQKATPADTAGTDGDYAMLQMSAGRLWVSSLIAASATNIAKAEDVASADADVGVPAMAVRKATPGNTSGTDGDYEMLQMANGLLWTLALGLQVTCSTDITRPNDTTAYAAGDAWSDSTSAPTSGGFTFTSAGRVSGGSGIITDAIITTSADASTLLQGEIWIFDTSVTNVNDNSAFAVSDSEIKTYVGKIAFTMEDAGNNGSAHVTGLNIGFTCVGSANLRYLVKVKNAYTPVANEVLTVRLKVIQTN